MSHPALLQLTKGEVNPMTHETFKGFETITVGVTQKPTADSQKLKTNPGQTFNISKWGADHLSFGAFNKQTDEWNPNSSYGFLKPLTALSSAKPFMWQYLSGLKIIYYTDEPPKPFFKTRR